MSFLPLPDITLTGSTPGSSAGESVELINAGPSGAPGPANAYYIPSDGYSDTIEIRVSANGYIFTSTVMQSFVQRFAISRASGVTTISASDTADQFGDSLASSWTFTVTVGTSPDRLKMTFTTGTTQAVVNVTADVFVTRTLTAAPFPPVPNPDAGTGFLAEWRGDYATTVPNTAGLSDVFWVARRPKQPNNHYPSLTNATITAFASPSLTIGGLSSMSANMVGETFTLSGAANPGNNGTFVITSVPNSTHVVVNNASGVFPDANSGSIFWNVQSTGTAASTSAFASPNLTITGLTGMNSFMVGQYLTLFGAASAGNNGTFLINSFISPSSVVVTNSSGVAPDANNGSIIWGMDDYYMSNNSGGGNASGHGNNWLLVNPWVNGLPAIGPGLIAGWNFWNSGQSSAFLVGDPPPPSNTQVSWSQMTGVSGMTIYMVLQAESITPASTQGFFSNGGGPTTLQFQLYLDSAGVLHLEDYNQSNNTQFYKDTYTAPGSMTSPGILMFQSQHNAGHVVEWNRTALTSTGTTTGGGGPPSFYLAGFSAFWDAFNPTLGGTPNTGRFTVGHILVYTSYHSSAQKTNVYNYINSVWGL